MSDFKQMRLDDNYGRLLRGMLTDGLVCGSPP